MTDNDTPTLQPGTILTGSLRYTIERVLGAGGFGITYLATTEKFVGNLRMTPRIAVKEHFVSLYNERVGATGAVTTPGSQKVRDLVANSMKDFLGEARRLQQLGAGHPNIVKVTEVFEANGTAYYVMEYLDGSSLWNAVDGRPMSEADMLALMLPVVDAVAYLHSNRLTHLDIKPQNIMLASDTTGAVRPVLIDFGLSKHYDAEGHATSTINTLACSDGYSPVEQYSGITTFTPAADVYALGATMLACLAGQTPPKSTEWLAGERMQYIDSLPISPALRDALRGALADGPARFPDAAALLAALGGDASQAMERRFLCKHSASRFLCEQSASRLSTSARPGGDQAVSNSAPTRQLSGENPPRKAEVTSRRPLAIILAAILASILVLGTAAYLLFGSHKGEPTPIAPADSTLIAEQQPATPENPQPAPAPAPAPAETEVSAPSPAPQPAPASTPVQNQSQNQNSVWDSHRRAENLYLAVQRNGTQYYFSQGDWNALSASQQAECRKLGVVIKYGSEPAFIIALEDDPGEYTWDEAMARFGNRLPTKEQGQAWVSQQEAVQNAVRAFGGHMPGRRDTYYSHRFNDSNRDYYFWTRAEHDSSEAWVVYPYIRTVYGMIKTYPGRVRPVAQVTE